MQNDDDLALLLRQRTLISRLQKNAREEKIPIIGKNTGYFLESVIKLSRPSNILEIGCGNGFSSYFIVKNLMEGSRYTGIDMNSQRLSDARKFIESEFPDSKIDFITGNALEIIPELTIIYDLVFIDAAKFEYPLYLKALMNNIKIGTIIIADDIFCQERTFSKRPEKHYQNSVEGLKQYLRLTGHKTKFETTILDIDDGLAISIYRGKE